MAAITFTSSDNNKKYTLEFNRRTCKKVEAAGFVYSELADKPATMVPLLFWGALQMHHSGTTFDTADELWDGIKHQKDTLIAALIELYLEPITTLVGTDVTKDEEDADSEGNADWEMIES